MRRQKAQFYYPRTLKREEGSTIKERVRHFIYSEDIYKSGGLWVSVRDVQASEAISSGLAYEKHNIKIKAAYNSRITGDCYVIFQNKIYNVNGTPDMYNFNKRSEMNLVAVETNDTYSYKGDEYEY